MLLVNGQTVIGRKQHFNQKKNKSIIPPSSNSVMITTDDIQRMQTQSRYAHAEKQEGAHVQETQPATVPKSETNTKADIRKARILEIENKRREMNQTKREQEKTSKSKQKTVKNPVERQPIINRNDISAINSMVLYAKCAAVRERQIEEKNMLKQQYQQFDFNDKNPFFLKFLFTLYDKRAEQQMDDTMEIERISAIKNMELEQQRKQEAIKESTKVLCQQLQHNQLHRLEERELKKKEYLQLRKSMQEQQAKEEVKKQKKSKEVEQFLSDFKAFNAQLVEYRKNTKEREMQEEKKREEYLTEKQKREHEYMTKKERSKQEREQQVQKICQAQINGGVAAELEDMRIQRAEEEKERKWREQQIKEAGKRAQVKQDIIIAHQRQKQEKEVQLAEEEALERAEFEKNVNAFKEQQNTFLLEQKKHLQKTEEYKQFLQSQMQQKANAQNQSEHKENIFQADSMQQQKAWLEDYKQQKILELQNAKIPSKYWGPLQKFNVMDLDKAV
ncbi:hypothetical protein RFI_10466 [Reticulomyxa filosa]|uniref:Cilia- and flagella-associated protein 45 n=1 Tax=Reticulomyxa filosa TaxID=46433 RepID=X6NK31_RETFI|nr:hypothetical protein RFI_10466 [Reticulomyxa filosa]|eukprot:ETO26670.1 hypothetical protein RFI_10466 [Reticulomyxa filosa]